MGYREILIVVVFTLCVLGVSFSDPYTIYSEVNNIFSTYIILM